MVLSVIKHNRLSLILLGMITFVFIGLVSLNLSDFANVHKDFKKIKDLSKKDAYFMRDQTKPENFKMSLIEGKNFEIMRNVFLYLLDNDIDFAAHYGYDGLIYKENTHFVNETFYDLIGITVKEGRAFTTEDYETKGETIPVLVGTHLSARFPIGYKGSFEDNVYEVVGVMKTGTSYSYYDGVSLEQSLDDEIVVPILNDMYKTGHDGSDFDMMFQNLIIFTDKKEVDIIQNMVSDMEVFEYEVQDGSKVISEAIDLLLGELISHMIINIILLLIAGIVFIILFGKIIRKNSDEMNVRRLCGAGRLTLSKDWFLIILITVMLPCFVVFFMFNFRYAIPVGFIFSFLMAIWVYKVYLRRTRV